LNLNWYNYLALFFIIRLKSGLTTAVRTPNNGSQTKRFCRLQLMSGPYMSPDRTVPSIYKMYVTIFVTQVANSWHESCFNTRKLNLSHVIGREAHGSFPHRFLHKLPPKERKPSTELKMSIAFMIQWWFTSWKTQSIDHAFACFLWVHFPMSRGVKTKG
jgi:hypothetical protein